MGGYAILILLTVCFVVEAIRSHCVTKRARERHIKRWTK